MSPADGPVEGGAGRRPAGWRFLALVGRAAFKRLLGKFDAALARRRSLA